MNVGRTIGAAILGLFFGLFVAIDLVLFGVVALNSVVVTIVPMVGLVLGIALGIMASKRSGAGDNPAPPALAEA